MLMKCQSNIFRRQGPVAVPGSKIYSTPLLMSLVYLPFSNCKDFRYKLSHMTLRRQIFLVCQIGVTVVLPQRKFQVICTIQAEMMADFRFSEVHRKLMEKLAPINWRSHIFSKVWKYLMTRGLLFLWEQGMRGFFFNFRYFHNSIKFGLIYSHPPLLSKKIYFCSPKIFTRRLSGRNLKFYRKMSEIKICIPNPNFPKKF